MCGNRGANGAGGDRSHPVGVRFDAELIDAGETVVEGAIIPEAVLGAAHAAMAGLDREGQAAVPAHGGAGVIGRRPFAAHLVEAVAFAGAFVVPCLDELAGIEMRAPIALV